ncbi:MAG TPA: hypothetical protein VIH87_01660 [Methylocella sp.]
MVKPKSLENKGDDGWARFEQAVDAAIKSGPKHKTAKPEKTKKGDPTKPDRGAILAEEKSWPVSLAVPFLSFCRIPHWGRRKILTLLSKA